LGAPSFISRRLSFKGRAAIASIAVSFLVIIIAISISDGFRKEISDALSDLRGDLRLEHMNSYEIPLPVREDKVLLGKILETRGVESVRPAIWASAIVKSTEDIHGVVFKGVHTADSAGMDVSIPRKLSSLLGFGPGDKMLAYFIGESVSVRNFNVVSVYDPMVTDDDKMVVLCDIHTLRRVLGWAGDEASALEITLENDYRGEGASLKVYDALSYMLCEYSDSCDDDFSLDYGIIRTRSEYPQLFDWLNLIDFNVEFILILMILVAGFNMVTGLLILLFENMSTIGLLKTMGMQFKDIARTFLMASGSLVLRGMLIGNVLGIGLCLVQQFTHILTLDPENYFLSFVPVAINPVWILCCDVIAFVAIMLILLVPCRFISKVDPSRSVAVN